MHRKVLVALVAIIVLCVTAASAANILIGGMESDGKGTYASVMTGVANGEVDFNTLSQGISVDSGTAYAEQDSFASGDGVVQQSATGDLYNSTSSLSATYTTAGYSDVEQTSEYSNHEGPTADAYQSSSGKARSIFSVVGTSEGQTEFSSAFVVIKDGYTTDPVMTAHLDDSGTSATLAAYSPNGLKVPGAAGELVSAGTVSNYYGVEEGKTAALVTNGGMVTNQMSGAGDDTTVIQTASIDNPQDSVGIAFTGGAMASQTTSTYGETNLVGSVATAGSDTASSSASSGWTIVGQVNGHNVYQYGTVSTSQTAAASLGGTALSTQIATDVSGTGAMATTNAHDASGNTATSSVTSSVGSVNAMQASFEGTNYANSLQNANGEGALVDAKTCAVDASGANANTNMKVTSGTLKSGAFSKALGMSSEAQQQGTNAGTDGSATTYARADGAVGNTVTSYQDKGSLNIEGSGSSALVLPGLKTAAAWQQGVEATGTDPYTNEHSSVGYGYFTAGASNANAQADSGTLNVGFAGTSSTDSFLGVNSAATQGGVSTDDGVNAQASTTVFARHVTAGTFDTVTDGSLAVGMSGSVVNDFNNGYHNAAAGQSGVAIDGTNVVAASNANTPQFSGSQVTGVDDGKVWIYGGQGAYADNYQGAASASGVVVSGDPGHVTSVAGGAGNNAVANAAFTAGVISLTGNQQAQATGSGADASQSGVDVAGVNAVASTNAYNWMNGASATGYTTFGGVSVDGTQSANVGYGGAGASQSDVSVGGVNAVASTNAHNWMYDSSATGSATFGGVDVDGYQSANVGYGGASANQVDVSAGGVNALVSTDANSWANGASATGSAAIGGVTAGSQSASVYHSGAEADQSDVSAGGVNAVVSTNAHNWMYDASATGSATFGGVTAGSQSAGVSYFGAGAGQSDVAAGGVNAVASTNAHSSVFDATTTGSALFGGVNVDGYQQASVNGYGANAGQHDVTAAGVGVVTSTNANSNAFDATSTAASLLGSASVDGYQSANVGYGSAGANQADVSAGGVNAVASTNAHSNTFDATTTGYAFLGDVSVDGYQQASVNGHGANAGQHDVTAAGVGVVTSTNANSNVFDATASGSTGLGSTTVWGDQTAGVGYGGAGATNHGTTASGFGAEVKATANSPVFSSTASGSARAGSVTAFGEQTANVDFWGTGAENGFTTAVGVDPTLETSSNGMMNSAGANANIGNGAVAGQQSSSVGFTTANANQGVNVKGAFGQTNTGTATVYADTVLANSGAAAQFTTNGGWDQGLGTSQNAQATTNLFTGYRSASAGQSADIDGYNGQTSTDATAESSWLYPDATASTSAYFTGEGSLDDENGEYSSATIAGYGAPRQASAGQDVDLEGMTVGATSQVNTGFNTNAMTTASATGEPFTYFPDKTASLSADQGASSTTNMVTGFRTANAGQDVYLKGYSASATTTSEAGSPEATANAKFTTSGNINFWDHRGTLDIEDQSASTTTNSWFGFKSASAENSGLSMITQNSNAAGSATTSASTDSNHWATTSASYGVGGGFTGSGGMIGSQSSTVTPGDSIAEQGGVIWGGKTSWWPSSWSTYPTATAQAKHGWDSDYESASFIGVLAGWQHAHAT